MDFTQPPHLKTLKHISIFITMIFFTIGCFNPTFLEVHRPNILRLLNNRHLLLYNYYLKSKYVHFKHNYF